MMPGFLIRRLQQRAVAEVGREVAAAGLDVTPVQYAALEALAAMPGADQTRLAARIAYDRVTIGGVIDRLVAKGFVARRTSESDRRARHLSVTPAGEAALMTLRPAIARAQQAILGPVPEEKRAAFLEALALLSNAEEA
ncbi:MAG: MarR family transcriptional regulator [Rhodobacteraceae bacterium]|nr:MarR family transcriptional regulator [Paracoccaceae bacterium]